MGDQSDPQKIGEAAREFASLAIERLADDHGVHAETVIAGTARMAGTFLFRSFGFELLDAKPGQAVLSELANEKGPRLVDVLAMALADAGIHTDYTKVTDASREGHEPLLGFLETQGLLEPTFAEVRRRLGLSLAQAADAGALATAILIQQTVDVLDPSLAFDIAVYSFIEGAKTVPANAN